MLTYFFRKLFKQHRPSSHPSSAQQASGPVIVPQDEHSISRESINKNALKVLNRLNSKGYEAYLVGGSVRDLLLGGKPKDFDVVTNANPQEIRRLFYNSYIVGRRFRLVHVRFQNDIIEVATFRAAENSNKDKQASNRYYSKKKHLPKGLLPYNNTYGTRSEDAFRRDIRVNALYYNNKDSSIIDYTDGLRDLKNKCINIIGDPAKRYHEDPVRLIRVIRFSAKLGFTIAADSADPIPKMAHLLSNVPKQRLFLETVKLFYTGCAEQALLLSRQYSLFERLFPDTEALLKKTPASLAFLLQACRNTDQRYADDLSLNAGFLFAVMLWPVFQESQQHTPSSRLNKRAYLAEHTYKIAKAHSQHMDMPEHIVNKVSEIWMLQYRFQTLVKSHHQTQLRLLRHPAFKAAYDFLLLRAKVGEPKTDNLAKRWTRLYENIEAKKANVLHGKKGK